MPARGVVSMDEPVRYGILTDRTAPGMSQRARQAEPLGGEERVKTIR